MPERTNGGDIRRFLRLRYKRPSGYGDQFQRTAAENIKKELTQSLALALCDSDRETVLSADTSFFRLGAVLRQTQPDRYVNAVSFASHSLFLTG